MSVYTTLAVSAVVLFVFLVLAVGGIIVAAVHLSKAYTVRQQCNLIRHGYDTGGHRGLKAMTEAVRSLDGDRRWGPRGDRDVAQRSVPSDDSDNSLAGAEKGQRALSAIVPPGEQFRRKL